MTRILAGLGRAVTGPADQRHVMPGSTAMLFPTDRGAVWFKASGPGGAHEGALLEVFRRRGVAHVLLPFAVHPSRPWLLLEDGGTTMRQTRPDGTGDHDLVAWERILREYAALQRRLEGPDAVAEMLAAGAPDGRPDRLPDELERLLDDDRPWSRVLPEERDVADGARVRLRAAVPLIRARATDLAASGIVATVQHDDLHGGNILVGRAGDRFFDWGDAIVAHPFGTLTTTFNSIAHTTGLSLEDPAFLRLRDAYLEGWSGVLAADELLDVTALARDLACIGKSLAWERAFINLEPDEMGDRGDSVAGWLMELAERLDEPRWGASTD
ncbi:MAG: aminoglycoside phosphotransferase family protein [Chloroflexota bacterium]